MRSWQCAVVIVIALTGAGKPMLWPSLPTKGFMVGRAATTADVERGNAVFATSDGTKPAAGSPAQIVIPQFAILAREGGEQVAVVVVQAEVTPQGVILGMRDAAGGEHVALNQEVTLLGVAQPR